MQRAFRKVGWPGHGRRRATTEMGPASLPTPLSPACGPLPDGELCLTPGASPQAGCGTLPGARAGAGPPVARDGAGTAPMPFRQSATGASCPATSSGCACARGHWRCHRWLDPWRSGRSLRVVPYVMLCRSMGSHLADASLCPTGSAMCFTLASQRFRGLAVALDRQGVPSLRLRALSAFRCRENARLDRVGQDGQRGTYPLLAQRPVDKGG